MQPPERFQKLVTFGREQGLEIYLLKTTQPELSAPTFYLIQAKIKKGLRWVGGWRGVCIEGAKSSWAGDTSFRLVLFSTARTQ